MGNLPDEKELRQRMEFMESEIRFMVNLIEPKINSSRVLLSFFSLPTQERNVPAHPSLPRSVSVSSFFSTRRVCTSVLSRAHPAISVLL